MTVCRSVAIELKISRIHILVKREKIGEHEKKKIVALLEEIKQLSIKNHIDLAFQIIFYKLIRPLNNIDIDIDGNHSVKKADLNTENAAKEQVDQVGDAISHKLSHQLTDTNKIMQEIFSRVKFNTK